MERWIVEPLKSVNGIEFGTKREIVREKIKKDYKEFKKNKFSKNTTDDYGTFHMFYNEKNSLIAVEIFRDIEVVVKNEIVFPGSLDKIKTIIPFLEKDDGCYCCSIFSVGVTAPEGMIESIVFGEQGYYPKYIKGVEEKNKLLEYKNFLVKQNSDLEYCLKNPSYGIINRGDGKKYAAGDISRDMEYNNYIIQIIERQLKDEFNL